MTHELQEDYVWKEIGDQVVVLHIDSGKYYSLNSTASLIWRAIMNQVQPAQIVEELCSVFEVNLKQSRKDANEMMQSFIDKGMIRKV